MVRMVRMRLVRVVRMRVVRVMRMRVVRVVRMWRRRLHVDGVALKVRAAAVAAARQ